MTEQQTWFLLIFTVPFVPAFIVFWFIKPQAGDARVGGTLPILKDLKLETGGAIATYILIVIFAIFAFWIITRDQAVAIHLIPAGPSGEPLDLKRVILADILPPLLTLKIPQNNKIVTERPISDFVYNAEKRIFTSQKSLYFTKKPMWQPVEIQISSNPFVQQGRTQKLLQPNMSVEVRLRDEILTDWLARVDRTTYALDAPGSPFSIKRFAVLTNVSKGTLDGRIEFSPWSVRGLSHLEFRTFRLSETNLSQALSALDAALVQNKEVKSRLADLAAAELELTKGASQIGHVKWDSTGSAEIGVVLGNDSAKIYAMAPTPRVDSVPGGIKPGESIITIVEARAKIPEDDVSPIVTLYSYLTERAIVEVNILNGPALCPLPLDVQIASPNSLNVLSRNNIWRSESYLAAQIMDVRKATKLIMPVQWKSSKCRSI